MWLRPHATWQFRDWNHGLVPKLWSLGHVLAPKPPWPGYGPALATLLEGGAVPPAKASANVMMRDVLNARKNDGGPDDEPASGS